MSIGLRMDILKLFTAPVALMALQALGGSAWADEPVSIAGTWQLNVARSKFTPGTEIKAQTRVYEVKGTEVKQIIDSVDAEGREVHSTWTAHYDGQDYALEGNPDANTIAVTQIDRFTTRSILKKDGKVVQTVERKLGKDGKTCTFKYDGANAKGMKIDNLLVFDRK